MIEETRIGVYVCRCGIEIPEVIDFQKVAKYAGELPNVVVSKIHSYLCSEAGEELIKRDIKEHRLNRIVVAACSPLIYENVFRKFMEEAGLNPYLLEMANLREHCLLPHLHQPADATEKAKALVRMAVERARLLKPLDVKVVEVARKALVVGGGVAGVQAALSLADAGFHVYLVEKEPHLGGRAAQLNMVTTRDSALDILTPMLKRAIEHPRIEVLVNSEIEEINGYVGNFNVKILKKPLYVSERCVACGKCVEVCPVEVSDEFNLNLSTRKAIFIPHKEAVPARYAIDENACTKCGKCMEVCEVEAINLESKAEVVEVKVGAIILATGFDTYLPYGEYKYGDHKDVITQLQLERLLSENGPTKGELVRPSNGEKPRNIVFILCVGSREPNRPYCSKICCGSALKNAILIKERNPDAEIFILYRDMRAFGKVYEEYYLRARELGVNFIRFSAKNPPKVSEDKEAKRLLVTVHDLLSEALIEIPADLLVLVEALIPRESTFEVGSKLKLQISPIGFFKVAHPKLNPIETSIRGVYLAGAVQSPKGVDESIVQAYAAASKAATLLSKGKILIEPLFASVDEELCSGCKICESLCEYDAVKVEEVEGKLLAKVIETLCSGCGVCVSSCPTGAITLSHSTNKQILAQVNAALMR